MKHTNKVCNIFTLDQFEHFTTIEILRSTTYYPYKLTLYYSVIQKHVYFQIYTDK